MIIKIEIGNIVFQSIILYVDTNLSYIELTNKEGNQNISIDNESIYSLITALHIIYREKFNSEYPNKSE